MPTSTDTQVPELIINTLTKAQYNSLLQNNQIDNNQLYLTNDENYYLAANVTYGTTTYAQITAMLTDHIEPVCYYNGYRYNYAGLDTYYYFTCVTNDSVKYIRVNSSDTWSNNSYQLQAAIMPDQTGNAGKFLATNGSTMSWVDIGSDTSDYVIKPTTIIDADNTDLDVAANTIYRFRNKLTTLTLSSIEISDYESVIYFSTDSSISFVDNSNIKWNDGVIPTLTTNTLYCIVIRNGLAEIGSFGAANNVNSIILVDNSLFSINFNQYLRKPIVVTDGDNTDLNIAENTIYKFNTALTTLTLSSFVQSDYESLVYFNTSSSINFTDNSNLVWKDSTIPSLNTNTRYCISICNGYAIIGEFGSIS